MPCVILLSGIMLNAVVLSVVMLGVAMLSVVTPSLSVIYTFEKKARAFVIDRHLCNCIISLC